MPTVLDYATSRSDYFRQGEILSGMYDLVCPPLLHAITPAHAAPLAPINPLNHATPPNPKPQTTSPLPHTEHAPHQI